MSTWRTESHVSLDQYTDEIHEQIGGFIWNSNRGKNQITKDDIEKRGQTHHGIVTLDGVVVSGNRRLMLISKIPLIRHFDAVILGDAYDESEKEIIRLETQYQYEDPTLDYGPLQKYLKVKRMREKKIEFDEIATLMGENIGKIKEWSETMELMDQYLDIQGYSGLYELLKEGKDGTLEDEFLKTRLDLKKNRSDALSVEWACDDDDVDQLESILFDHIRFGNPGGKEKDFRLISNEGRGKNSLFHHEELWKPFAAKHASEIDTITAEEMDFDEYCNQNSDFTSRVEVARKRDNEWRGKVNAPLKANFGQMTDKLEVMVSGTEPTRLLQRAWNALSGVDFMQEDFTAQDINKKLVDDLNGLIWEMKQRISKSSK